MNSAHVINSYKNSMHQACEFMKLRHYRVKNQLPTMRVPLEPCEVKGYATYGGSSQRHVLM